MKTPKATPDAMARAVVVLVVTAPIAAICVPSTAPTFLAATKNPNHKIKAKSAVRTAALVGPVR